MPATIPSSKRCSAGSARACILRPAPSRLLRLWLLVSHAVAALGILGLPLPPLVRGLALALLLGHAWRSRPRAPEPLVLNRSGLWALPASDVSALRLGAKTAHGPWWADLELIGPQGRRRLLLCRDQLGAADWRALQLALRRARPGRNLS